MLEFRLEAVSYGRSPDSADRYETCKVSVFFETHTLTVLSTFPWECTGGFPEPVTPGG